MRFSAKAIAVLGCLMALAGCGAGASGSAHQGSKAPTKAGVAVAAVAVAGPTAKVAVPAAKAGHGTVKEVADPLEADSYPAPASVHHASAATPARAGELVVAAGARSDAEVRRELQQMQAVEESAKQTQQRVLTPVAGGQSVGGNGTIAIPANVPEVIQ